MNLEEKHYPVTLIEIKKIINDIYTFKFSKPDINWSEGTNVHLAFNDFKEHEAKKYERHFSIINLPEEQFISFTTRLSSSPFKIRLMKMKLGDEMIMYKFTQRMPLRLEDKPIVLLSMGVGVAAFRTAIKTFEINSPHSLITNINISQDESLYLDEFSTTSNLSNLYVNSRDAFTHQVLKTYSKDSIYYIVGSDPFIEENVKFLLEQNHNPAYIEMDKKENTKHELLGL